MWRGRAERAAYQLRSKAAFRTPWGHVGNALVFGATRHNPKNNNSQFFVVVLRFLFCFCIPPHPPQDAKGILSCNKSAPRRLVPIVIYTPVTSADRHNDIS